MLYTQMLSQAGAQSILGCSCIQSAYEMMMNVHQSQTKGTLRTSLSGGARLALLMLAQLLIIVAVITDSGQHSWHAMWIATLDCSNTSDQPMHNNMQTITLYQTVATLTHKA